MRVAGISVGILTIIALELGIPPSANYCRTKLMCNSQTSLVTWKEWRKLRCPAEHLCLLSCQLWCRNSPNGWRVPSWSSDHSDPSWSQATKSVDVAKEMEGMKAMTFLVIYAAQPETMRYYVGISGSWKSNFVGYLMILSYTGRGTRSEQPELPMFLNSRTPCNTRVCHRQGHEYQS